MDKQKFIENFRNAFGNYELPIVFWYSDKPVKEPNMTKGCFVNDLKKARGGMQMSLNEKAIDCPGAKAYLGFAAPSPRGAEFIANQELYKETSEMVMDWAREMNAPDEKGKHLNFASIECIEDLNKVEGLIFFATPDVLSGLVSWVLYDTNEADAVSVPFGSGCTSMITRTAVENRKNGTRTFLGMFDPSARPSVEANVLSLAIPMSRFKKMYYTFEQSCLSGTHDWNIVKERIIKNGI